MSKKSSYIVQVPLKEWEDNLFYVMHPRQAYLSIGKDNRTVSIGTRVVDFKYCGVFVRAVIELGHTHDGCIITKRHGKYLVVGDLRLKIKKQRKAK